MSDSGVGLLLSRDLFFTSKVTGTAQALGLRVLAAGSVVAAESHIREHAPRTVFVDLSAGDLASSETIVKLREAAGPGVTFLAFGSHVDTNALASAARAGCDPVLPRSNFSAELPVLLTKYLTR